jgi:hypothetical protein
MGARLVLGVLGLDELPSCMCLILSSR